MVVNATSAKQAPANVRTLTARSEQLYLAKVKDHPGNGFLGFPLVITVTSAARKGI
jgi:hypothetical protein